MISEIGLYFFPNGGHDHDGVNSSLIDTSAYSIFDFEWSTEGSTPFRDFLRQTRYTQSFLPAIRQEIIDVLYRDAGIYIQPGSVGAGILIANSITANEIAADTITANEIAAGTITADLFSANIVLVNQVIASNNYVPGVSGWAINGNGNAEFASTAIRGAIVADSVSTPGVDILSNGAIVSNNFSVTPSGILTATGASITGSLFTGGLDIYANGALVANNFSISTTGVMTATAGRIAGWDIVGANLITGAGFPGSMSIGPTAYEGNTPAYYVEAPLGGNRYGESVLFAGGMLCAINSKILDATAEEIVLSDGANSSIILPGLIGSQAFIVDDYALIDGNLYIDGDGMVGLATNYFDAYGKGVRYPNIPGPGQGFAISFDYTNNGGIFYGVVNGDSNVVLSLDFVNISDRRVKDNISILSNKLLNKIYSLNVYEYDFNDKTPLTHLRGQHRIGLMADEVKEVFPEYVQFESQEEECVYKYLEHPEGMTVEQMEEYGDNWNYVFKEDGVYTVPVYEHITYKEFIPHLIAAVSNLNERLKALEQQLGYNS